MGYTYAYIHIHVSQTLSSGVVVFPYQIWTLFSVRFELIHPQRVAAFSLMYRFVREKEKLLEEEAQVMANVVGWKVGENVYNSGRWMPPATGKLGMDS